MSLDWLIADFETLSDQDVTDIGAAKYAESPNTEVACLGIREQRERGWLWRPGDGVDRLDALARNEHMTWIAFNCMFERSIWHEIMVPEFNLPPIPLPRWHDIQASAAMKGLPQSLEAVADELHLDINKDKQYRDALKKLTTPNKKGELPTGEEREALLQLVYLGCLQDLDVEYAAHEVLGFLPPGGERLDWLLTQKTNERGIKLDMPYIHACQAVVNGAKPELLAEFGKLTGGLKPGQVAKYIAWLEEHGFRVPEKINPKGGLSKTLGREEIKNLIGDVENGDEIPDDSGIDIAPDVLRSLRIRQLVGASSITKLDRMAECVNADGRSRGLLHWHGTGPGRSAGRLWQPHNLPKPTIKIDGEAPEPEVLVPAIMSADHEYVDMMIGPPIQAVAGGLRHAMIAEEGHTYISGDYAGIQARLVLAIAGQDDKTAMMASGQDVYCDMAQTIFHKDPPITKETKHIYAWERGIGKNSVLGLGFQMGAFTFYHKYVWLSPPFEGGWDNEENQDFCGKVVRTYRKEWAPLVPEVWYALEGAALECVLTEKPTLAYGCMFQIVRESEHVWWLVMTVPSGGKVWYFCPTKYYDNKFNRDAFFVFSPSKGSMSVDRGMFGGRITENCIMRLEHDLMTVAKAKCEKNGLPVVLEVHDEILTEPVAKTDAEIDAAVKLQRDIMLDLPEWAKKIKVPINIDQWSGPRYKKG